MRITIAAVGKLKAGAERTMAERYLARSAAIGRTLNVSIEMREAGEARGGTVAERAVREAAALARLIPQGAFLVVLDETGKSFSSADFSSRLGAWRDAGRGDVAFVVGGADGVDGGLKRRADLVLSLGAMTWPHQLARLMLLEQLYRALAILSGHPYHRDGQP